VRRRHSGSKLAVLALCAVARDKLVGSNRPWEVDLISTSTAPATLDVEREDLQPLDEQPDQPCANESVGRRVGASGPVKPCHRIAPIRYDAEDAGGGGGGGGT
jgi:hypothetical protein